MKPFWASVLLTWLLLLAIERLVTGIHFTGTLNALLAALALGVINGLVRPILIMLTLPLTVVTLGLFLLVVNAVLFKLASLVVPGFEVNGFQPAFFGSLLLSVLNVVVSRAFNVR